MLILVNNIQSFTNSAVLASKPYHHWAIWQILSNSRYQGKLYSKVEEMTLLGFQNETKFLLPYVQTDYIKSFWVLFYSKQLKGKIHYYNRHNLFKTR